MNLKAYNVPKAHEEIAEREVQHLVDCGVLRRISTARRVFLPFSFPRKTK